MHQYEISKNPDNESLFARVIVAFAIETPAVPLVVVGERAFVGYLDDQSSGRAIRESVLQCYAGKCPDIVGFIARQIRGKRSMSDALPPTISVPAPLLPETIRLPIIGEISTATVSLPVLTVLLAGVDGFNPCAMWALVFLVGLLLGMTDHLRMWALGAAFLLASAAVYFVFMAAWLNLLLLLGALAWIRGAIGLLALGGAAFYVRDYIRNPVGSCAVTAPGERQRLMSWLREIARQRNFLLALAGIVVVAVAVNLIELLCSAGIPAVYMQVLTLSALPSWQYYVYLALYIVVFLFDDLVIFATAMVTLRASGLTAGYARYSRLVGGGVLGGLGILLLFRPDWLKFGA
jgi:hypothetical protein